MSKKKDSNNKKCEIFVDGMHCASCEVLIEKKLKEQEGVVNANASTAKGRAVVSYKDGHKPDIDALNNEFKDLGYAFSYEKINRSAELPFFQFKNGALSINQTKLGPAINTLVILLVLVGAFFVLERAQLGRFVSVDSTSSLGAFFLLGLVAASSTCAALVGGLLLSMTKQWNDQYLTESASEKAKPHILFHSGRLISFALLGGLLGSFGSLISLDNLTLSAILILLVSALMLLLALQMIGVRWAQRFTLRTPKFITRLITDESSVSGKYVPFVTGALTFFVPCGFTIIAQGVALTSGSFFSGALIMLFFALGTLPILAGISLTGVRMNRNPNLSNRFNKIAGLMVIFFVIYNVNSQLNVLGLPSLSDVSFRRAASAEVASTSSEDAVEDGQDDSEKQILRVVAEGFSYIPQGSTTLKAGVPTVLEVDNQGIQGCGRAMAARGLFSGYYELKPGMNEIRFTPEKGTYKLTCTMGMVPPVTIKVI